MRCPHCGKNHPDFVLFCPETGQPLAPPPADDGVTQSADRDQTLSGYPPVPPPPGWAPASPETPSELPPVPTITASQPAGSTCPQCGAAVYPGWVMCAACGYTLTQPEPARRPRRATLLPVVLIGIAGLAAITLGIMLLTNSGIFAPRATPQATLPAASPTRPAGGSPTPPRTSIPGGSTAYPAATPSQTPTRTPTSTRTPTAVPSATTNAPTIAITLVSEMVDTVSEAGSYNALAFDSNGTAALVYLKDNPDLGTGYDRDQLMYAQRVGSSWAPQVVTNGRKNEGWVNSLKADAQGSLHLSSYAYEDQQIYYGIKRPGTAWNLRPVFAVPRSPDAGGTTNVPPPVSLAVSASGVPHIAYLDAGNNRLMYLDSNKGLAMGNWTPRVVASGVTREGVTFPMTVNADGQPLIAFYNGAGTAARPAGLQVARFDGSQWTIETVAANPSSGAKVGLYPAMASDERGRILLAYLDRYEEAVKLVVFDGKTWSTPVKAAASSGSYISLAVNSKTGQAHLAYYNDSTLTLEYTTGSETGFATPLILQKNVPMRDGNSKESKHLSLAVDANGGPWISFFDPGEMRLKVFRPASK